MASTFERVINIARDRHFSSNPEASICLDGLSFSDRQIEKEDDQNDVGDRSQRAFGLQTKADFDSRLDSLDRVLFLGSGLDEIVVDEQCDVVGVRDWKLGGVVVRGGAGYGGGGSLTGGGGSRGGSGGGDGDRSSGYWDSNHGNNITEEY
ncbi:unnamed protein product [Camellia sinensis]